MPPSKPAPALIAGPYKPPRCRVGKPIYDLLHGDLAVVGISDAPVPWPLVKTDPRASRAVPAMTPELKRAIETESVEAVVHHFGTSRWTIRRWRHALKVPRFNPGTTALWRELAADRLAIAAAVGQMSHRRARSRPHAAPSWPGARRPAKAARPWRPSTASLANT
jgi:hypothetical protein